MRRLKKADLEIQQGDYVDFGPYGKCYVCNPDYSDNYFWITDNKEDRDNPDAEGWSISKKLAKKVIERFEEDEEF